jgi:hypothetical protein
VRRDFGRGDRSHLVTFGEQNDIFLVRIHRAATFIRTSCPAEARESMLADASALLHDGYRCTELGTLSIQSSVGIAHAVRSTYK